MSDPVNVRDLSGFVLVYHFAQLVATPCPKLNSNRIISCLVLPSIVQSDINFPTPLLHS